MKKRQIRALGLILAASLTLSLAGCGKSAAPKQDTKEESATEEEDAEESKEKEKPEKKTQKPSGNEAKKEEIKKEVKEEELLIEGDIPDLRSVVASDDGLGQDAIVGACLGTIGAGDKALMQLVRKHFNAVTLENELKPDALFGYNNDAPPIGSIHEEDFNGEKLEVPTLDFSRADAILDLIQAYNELYPDKAIRVRGHVLVWHSQTPEWFFHEGYDKNASYVTAEVMDKRQEWYIASVLQHYTASDSPYQGLFYGWDVVNEAISDTAGIYRSDTENGADKLSDSTHGSKSSWWKVYQNPSYIVNAFKYANKYAPADLKLYYNDYNECDDTKSQGILKLIEAVKADKDARIDGFGMQGHYTVGAPSAGKVEEMAREYAKAAGSVMLTELDVKTSAQFDGSKEKIPEEYNRQAAYYNGIYEAFKTLKKEGLKADGITVWGVIDTYSWLQDANNVGGASDGKVTQYPLLFDGEYKAKLSYWAFTDPSKIDFAALEVKRPTMEIHKGTVDIDGEIDEVWDSVEATKLGIVVQSVDVTCDAKLLWDEEYLYVLMEVTDPDLNDDSEDDYQQDSIEVFIDEDHGRPETYAPDDKQYRVSFNNKQSFNGEKCVEANISSMAQLTEGGYLVEAAMKWTDITPAVGTQIGLELQVNDAGNDGVRKGTLSWADDTGTCYLNPSMNGHATLAE